MKIIGLTGSIGMGKSTVAGQFASEGAHVFSADDVVHRILKEDKKIISQIASWVPECVVNGAIDRTVLGERAFADSAVRKKLESLLHPKTFEAAEQFARKHPDGRHLVMEVPLLFEAGSDTRCDVIVVVTAPPEIQRERVMQRKHMTEEKFAAILAAQMPDAEKRTRADYVIETGKGREHSLEQVRKILKELE